MAMSKQARQAKIAEIMVDAAKLGLWDRVKMYAQYRCAKDYGLKPAYDNESLREYVELHELALRRLFTKDLKTEAEKEARLDAAVRTAHRKGFTPLHYANPGPKKP